MKPLLLRHLEGEPVGHLPVWMMRQAGRYLPNYRAIRKDHGFWEMVTTPELIVKTSLTPMGVVPVDAIIFFSDILTLPYAQGITIEMKEAVGPVIVKPLQKREEFSLFTEFDPCRHTAFVGEALTALRRQIPSEMALLGFAGAPWTVACYLTEGGGSKHFEKIKSWMFRDPKNLTEALDDLGEATFRYLKFQHDSGVNMVQVFDTWLAEMPRTFFLQYYQPVMSRLFGRLREAGIPTIYYSRNAHHVLRDFVEFPLTAVSIDGLITLTEADKRFQGKFSLQGNLDPILLLGDESVVRRETRKLVEEARRLTRPAILNLGHGILPQTPVANAKAFVEEARALWI